MTKQKFQIFKSANIFNIISDLVGLFILITDKRVTVYLPLSNLAK